MPRVIATIMFKVELPQHKIADRWPHIWIYCGDTRDHQVNVDGEWRT